jgi:thymidine kinase
MSLELIIGPMFSGKSTRLLDTIKRNRFAGIKTFCVTSSFDTRWAKEISITTHANESFPAVSTQVLSDIRDNQDYKNAICIIIEEAQFFPDLKEFVLNAVEVDGKRVICAGLDGDSQRRPFGQILDLIPYCNSVTKLNAKCTRCELAAIFTFRKSDAVTEQVYVAGADEYEALCRSHYLEFSCV